MFQKGDQNTLEEDVLSRGQGLYNHTRKDAVSMIAKQMVSNDPNLRKVSLILNHCTEVIYTFQFSNAEIPAISVVIRSWSGRS